MSRYSSLSEALVANQRIEDKGITFITGPQEEKVVSYKQLYERALSYLHHLQQSGMEPGQKLIYQIDDNESFVYMFWACILGGFIPVPLTVGTNDEHKLKMFRIWSLIEEPYLVTARSIYRMLENFSKRNGLAEDIAAIGKRTLFLDDMSQSGPEGIIHPTGLDDLAFIQFSSGSTGDPKGVMLTHGNVLSNANALNTGCRTLPDDRLLNWMPLTHDMGLIALHITPLVDAYNQYMMPTLLFIRNPVLWMKKANEHKITILASPNFGYKYFLDYFKPEYGEGWDLSHVRFICNGAEPISADVCHRFLDIMNAYGLRKSAMLPVYGLAEGTVCVTLSSLEDEFVTVSVEREAFNVGEQVKLVSDPHSPSALHFVEVGAPLQDCDIRICDENNRQLPEEHLGYIQIKGKNVTSGYYKNQEATDKAMAGDGWLHTGDTGFMTGGRLVVAGRLKDIIFVNGKNYYPHDIEKVAEGVEGVELGKVAVCGVQNQETNKDDIVMFVFHLGELDTFVKVAAELKQHIGRGMGLEVHEVIPVKSIPRSTSGKVQRYKLRDSYQAGEYARVLEELGAMAQAQTQQREISLPTNEIEEKLLQICSGVLETEGIGMDDSFFDHGGTSIQINQIYAQVDVVYPNIVTVTDMFTYPSIAKLAQFIAKSVSATALDSVVLQSLPLSPDYYGNGEGALLSEKKVVYQYAVEQAMLTQLSRIAQEQGIEQTDIYLTLYIYMIAEMSGSSQVSVPSLLNGDGVIVPVDVALAGISSLTDLMQRVQGQRRNNGNAGIPAAQLSRVKPAKGEYDCIPVFYRKHLLDDAIDPFRTFDLALATSERHDRIYFDFNQKRMNGARMKAWFNRYVKLLKGFVETYK
ncbi:non-ribosomal peptide synthetase [Paenibacillus oenotherae]|uniref:Non-ribosomal peptide synthetase n=1 Tax=Paenibacillus oenotherae TaxID=1435645 RepID=A0ABS7DAP5_9BACL|nr:non-ribosomal peptide synthetase [Paenibacillus oenotherae]MBW7476951.1 non-ribosomal peptide synthetase [Paenibacillus oenotherae]